MQVFYCDACGNKMGSSMNIIEIPCHLYSKRREVGYVDIDMNNVSGRKDYLEVCNACNNKIMGAAVQSLLDIQGWN